MTELETFIINNWPLLTLAVIWSIVWTGLGLWRAARVGHKYWFVAMLLINSLGLLEILYIYYFAKRSQYTTEYKAS